MQNLKKLINFWLISSLFLANYSFADDENECPQGQVYDSTLNRCVLTQDTVETKTDSLKCKDLEGDAYKKCFDDNVQKDLADAEQAGDIKKETNAEAKYGIPAVVTLGAGYLLWKHSDALKQCGQTSMWLMLGGGAGSLLGEFMAQDSYKKDLKKIIKKYEEQMQEKPDDDEEIIDSINENQKIAFDFQIEQEKARKDAHKARKNTYNLAFGLYTSAALASIYDGTFSSSKGCETAMFTPIQRQNPFMKTYKAIAINKDFFGDYYFLDTIENHEILEIVQRKIISQFSTNLYAEEEESNNTSNIGGVIAAKSLLENSSEEQLTKVIEKNNAESGTGDTVDKAIKNPWVRAAVAGVLAGYSKSVANKAGKLADEASDRISLLETLRDDFLATGGGAFGGCTEEDRSDSSKLGCYCYLADGTKNPQREKSNACQGIFSSSASLAASKYGVDASGSSSSGLSGCFDLNRNFDPNCECKSKKTSSGKNSCMSLTGKVKLGSLGSIKELRGTMKDANAFTSGNMATSDLNPASYERLAIKSNAIKKKLSKNPKYKKQLSKVNALEAKIKKQLASKTRRALASGKVSSPFGGSLNSAVAPISKNNVMKNLKKEVAKDLATRKGGGGKISSSKSRSLNDYDLGGGSSQGGVTVDDSYEIMKKDFNFNDINENSDNNIFKIISVRYQRSAFGRLFDEKGNIQRDAANETDINEK